MHTMTYPFIELPLLIDRGFEAGLVNGYAEITYTDDVIDFTVTGLWLDGYKAAEHTEEAKLIARLKDECLPRFIEKPVPVEVGTWLDTTITSRLYDEYADKVHDAIRKQLLEARSTAVDDRADMRRQHALQPTF